MSSAPEHDPNDPGPPEAPVAQGVEETSGIRMDTPHDPTRFGDWERAGRCIDF